MPNADVLNKLFCTYSGNNPKYSEETVIYAEGEITLFKITSNSQRFNDVISLRQEYSDDVIDLYDNSASIYVIYQKELPLATTRVIEAQRSKLDFEESLPFKIEQCFRQFIGSASRLAVTQKQKVPKSLINLLVGVSARDQFQQGIRFDLIVCREKLIPYYKRIGHQLLPYPSLVHPRTGASCHLMLWVMTLRQTRFANQYFSHLPDTLEVEAFNFLERVGGNQVNPCQLVDR